MLGLVEDLKPVYLALPLSDQKILDAIFEALIQHKAAFNNSANLLPLEVLEALGLLEAYKRDVRIRAELYEAMDNFRREIDERLSKE